MQWLAWFQRRTDAWLTPALLERGPQEVARARLAVWMGLMTAAWGPVFAVVYVGLGLYVPAVAILCMTLYLGSSPWLMSRHESTRFAAHHTASTVWFAVVALCLQSGGIHSSALPWLASCSFVAIAIGGWRPALFWLAVSQIGVAGFALVAWLGISFGSASPEAIIWLRGTSLIGLTLFVFVLVAVFQLEHDALGRTLESKVGQLAEANRAKSLFLANMSHELRTPMNAILGYTELAREELEEGPTEAIDQDLGRVQTAGTQLLALIDDLLDLSRIEVGALELDVDDLDLDRIVADVLSNIAPYATQRQTDLDAQLDTVRARCDRVRTTQIVTNLVHNAVKFTGTGQVRVRCTLDADRAVVEVRDTGPGLTSEQLDRIFDEFQQAHPSVRAVHGGTGLGLAISRRLARAMGGEVSARSEPGVGSTFRVELPLAA